MAGRVLLPTPSANAPPATVAAAPQIPETPKPAQPSKHGEHVCLLLTQHTLHLHAGHIRCKLQVACCSAEQLESLLSGSATMNHNIVAGELGPAILKAACNVLLAPCLAADVHCNVVSARVHNNELLYRRCAAGHNK
jgi:hypothetical protein